MSIRILAALVFAGLFLCAAPAVQAAVQYLNYEDASKLVLFGNPDLVTLRKQEESLKFHARQSLAPNNPVFSVSKNDLISPSPFSTPASTVLGLAFTLGFPGKAFATSTQFEDQADGLREQALAKELELLMSLSNVYVSLSINGKLQKILETEIDKAREITKLIERRYSLAQAQQTDVLNSKVFTAGLEQELLAAQGDHEILISQFRNLIKKPQFMTGSADDASYEPIVPGQVVVPDLKYSAADLTQVLMKNRHLLKAAEYQTQATGAAVAQASLAPFPDFQLTGAINLYHLPSAQPIDSVSRTYSAGIAVSIPIFFPLNEWSGVHAAVRDHEAAEQQEESQRLSSVADLQSFIVKFQQLSKQRQSFEEYVLPSAKASYELTLKTYSLGKTDYLKLNDARESWIQAQKDYLQRTLDQAQAYNSITQQVGCDLSHKGGPHACL